MKLSGFSVGTVVSIKQSWRKAIIKDGKPTGEWFDIKEGDVGRIAVVTPADEKKKIPAKYVVIVRGFPIEVQVCHIESVDGIRVDEIGKNVMDVASPDSFFNDDFEDDSSEDY